MKIAKNFFPALMLVFLVAISARAQSFQVQCPSSTTTHPTANAAEPPYLGPDHENGAIKCQQISGGDGFATMGDGVPTYLFAFGPLSGMQDMTRGLPSGGTEFSSVFNVPYDGAPQWDPTATMSSPNGAVGLAPDVDAGGAMDGHVDPRPIMDMGVLNGNMPAPLMSLDEDDEFFLTLTNVGQIMRPDLFEQHTVHFHGYPNASAFYDGVPDASVAINIGGSFTYYYLAPDAGTYLWHCHITPPEHLQMGMVGQIYVRPRQNRVPVGNSLLTAYDLQQTLLRTKSDCAADILCSTPRPMVSTGATQLMNPKTNPLRPQKYAYNDGDGTTAYDVEYPIQIHGFDPNFHFVGMTFNPENFTDMKDKYFLLNGRSYPDTISTDSITTQSPDGISRFAQPLSSLINIPVGGKALLRLSSLEVTEFQTLASLGIPMTVVGVNARLLRDQSGNNLYYNTNSITLGGGESMDVILDASDTTKYPANSIFYLYTPELDHLSNDAENFGGLMTEVHIINCAVNADGQCR